MIKDCQVCVAKFGAGPVGKLGVSHAGLSRAYPTAYTIGRQGVVIPRDVSFVRNCPGELVAFIESKATVAFSILRNTAFVGADATLDTGRIARHFGRQVEGDPGFSMCLSDLKQDIVKVVTNTVGA